MIMAAVAYNLKKMMKWTDRKINTCSEAMRKTAEMSVLKLINATVSFLILYIKGIEQKLRFNILLT